MHSVRLNLAIILVVASGCAAGLAVVVGLGGAGTSFARDNRELLMLALPVLASIFGALGGYLVGAASFTGDRAAGSRAVHISRTSDS